MWICCPLVTSVHLQLCPCIPPRAWGYKWTFVAVVYTLSWQSIFVIYLIHTLIAWLQCFQPFSFMSYCKFSRSASFLKFTTAKQAMWLPMCICIIHTACTMMKYFKHMQCFNFFWVVLMFILSLYSSASHTLHDHSSKWLDGIGRRHRQFWVHCIKVQKHFFLLFHNVNIQLISFRNSLYTACMASFEMRNCKTPTCIGNFML